MRRLVLISALTLYASPLAAQTVKSVHYSYRERDGALQQLGLHACPWQEAISLFEHRLHASILLDPKLEKKLSRQVIDFQFKDVDWENALRILALANGYQSSRILRGSFA